MAAVSEYALHIHDSLVLRRRKRTSLCQDFKEAVRQVGPEIGRLLGGGHRWMVVIKWVLFDVLYFKGYDTMFHKTVVSYFPIRQTEPCDRFRLHWRGPYYQRLAFPRVPLVPSFAKGQEASSHHHAREKAKHPEAKHLQETGEICRSLTSGSLLLYYRAILSGRSVGTGVES